MASREPSKACPAARAGVRAQMAEPAAQSAVGATRAPAMAAVSGRGAGPAGGLGYARMCTLRGLLAQICCEKRRRLLKPAAMKCGLLGAVAFGGRSGLRRGAHARAVWLAPSPRAGG